MFRIQSEVPLKNSFTSALLFVVLVGCESAGTGTQVPPPNINVTCSTAKCQAANSTHDIVVNLSPSGCAPDQIGFEDGAVGTGIANCAGGSCTATVSNWADSSVESKSYWVCGWIDLDDNGKNAADVYSENYQLVTGASISMTNWSVTYSFSRKNNKNK
jgi:hypothetical protein